MQGTSTDVHRKGERQDISHATSREYNRRVRSATGVAGDTPRDDAERGANSAETAARLGTLRASAGPLVDRRIDVLAG